jgi:hypothetical protein
MNEINQIVEKMSQFEVIESVVRNAENSELDPKFYEHVNPFLRKIADIQNLTPDQALMLCLMMNFCDSSNIRLGNLAHYTGLSTVYLLKYLNDIDVLVKRGFLKRADCCNTESYAIRLEAINALKQDKALEKKSHSGVSCQELFGLIGQILNEEDDYDAQRVQILNLLQDNSQLKIAQVIKGHQLNADDTMLLMLFCFLFVDNEDDMVQISDFDELIDNNRLLRAWGRQLSREQHPLQQKKLIEFNSPSPMIDGRYYHLTDGAKTDLLGELGICLKKKTKKQSLPKDFVSHKSVVAKQMFYTRDNQAQVDRLAQLLDEKKFRDVCRRMKERGMRTGFACLFYGAPGTGKTETVMQLARQMKRDVMVVDFSQIRSKWVGDSEKNIKGVFERYRHFCKQLRRKPILLFNEADAVINTRQEQATHSVDKMENTMQNIILQEMEQFDGIMIATTNLAQNMDPAFERRFLYKIQFERPDASVRARLWQEMIPELDTGECQALGMQFDFSGGQIENVARKYAINTILNDVEPSNRLAELITLCREECLNDTQSTRAHVGFVA